MDSNGPIDTSFMNSEDHAMMNEILEAIKMENQSPEWNTQSTTPAEYINIPQQQQLANQSIGQQNAQIFVQNQFTPAPSKFVKTPYLKIVEQPAPYSQRFRYQCEGRSAGSIPGATSTTENKTFPTVEIVNCNQEVKIVVLCVTMDPPYAPHPHRIVGKDGGGQVYRDGICTVRLTGPPYRAVFCNLGVQCVKIKDIWETLEERIKNPDFLNPFDAPYPDRNQKSPYDLAVVRLCFQPYVKQADNSWKKLQPQISEPIYDKKQISELTICRLCSCSAKVNGDDSIILLCDKVNKADIRIKFTEKNREGRLTWEAFAEFQQHDIHKQTAITFRTPRYHRLDITDPVKVQIQLERPSDNAVGVPIDFEYYPNPGMRTFTRIRRKIKRKEELDIFQQILSLDSETTLTKYSCPPTDVETCNDDIETVSSDSSASKPNSSDTLNEYEAMIRRRMCSEADTRMTDDEVEVTRARELDIEFEVPHINYPVADESTQTSTPMDEILKNQQLPFGETRPLSAVDKITEWMRSSEFERTDSLTVENGDTTSLSPVTVYTNVTTSPNNQTTISTTTDDDKTFTELMEQVAELDDMLASASRRGTLENPIVKELPIGGEISEAVHPTASTHPSVEIDENFDETATYTSLQRAFKNPLELPLDQFHDKSSSQSSTITAATVEDVSGLVVLTNPPAPKIKVNAAQTPPSPPSPPLAIPPRTPSPGPDQRGPPLPPKRRVSHELNGSNNSTPSGSLSRTRNGSLPARPTSQIIIMRTPEQSPTKRQSIPTPTASPKKKQGFFSRLFSRKSKSDFKVEAPPEPPVKTQESKATTPIASREPSIGHFSLADPKRSSVRSAKSLQPHSPGLSPHSSTNVSVRSTSGKPVGRSSSSVSGKRPAHLNADVIHIPLKGDESEERTISTFGRQLDRRTLSALQLADIPVCDGNMELVAIADRQSIKNLCEGDFGVILDPSVDLGEAEHFALYTSVVPPYDSQADSTVDDCDGRAAGSNSPNIVSAPLLTADEIAMRLAQANGLN